MRERGEAEAGGVRVLLQSVAPSQSGSETLSWRGYGEDGCCVTLNTPTWTLSESLLYYTLFRRVHSDSTVLLSFVFLGQSDTVKAVSWTECIHARTHTHNTALAVLAPQAKDFGPSPPFVHCLCTHTLSNTFTIMHRRKCNSPTGASFREAQSTVDPISKGSNPNMQRG